MAKRALFVKFFKGQHPTIGRWFILYYSLELSQYFTKNQSAHTKLVRAYLLNIQYFHMKDLISRRRKVNVHFLNLLVSRCRSDHRRCSTLKPVHSEKLWFLKRVPAITGVRYIGFWIFWQKNATGIKMEEFFHTIHVNGIS